MCKDIKSFDPQALTSLTNGWFELYRWENGFDPQALTSLTNRAFNNTEDYLEFRSTGSYEPDRALRYHV